MRSVIFKQLQYLIVAILVTSLTFLVLQPHYVSFADDPGVGWHLKTGELVLESASPPVIDPYLAGERREWVYDQLLGGAFLAYIKGSFGWSGAYLTFGLIFAVTYFGVVFFASQYISRSLIASLLASAIALNLSTVQFLLRPVVISLLFFAVLYAALLHFDGNSEGRDNPLSTRALLGTVLFFSLWANIHPFFILGLILIGIFVFAKSVLRFAGGLRSISPFEIAGALAAFLGTLLTPYGVNLYGAIFSLGSSEFFTGFLQEWQPLDYKSSAGSIVEFSLVTFVVALLITDLRKKLTLFQVLSFGAFLHFAHTAVRGVSVFAIIFAPILAISIAELLKVNWLKRFPLLSRGLTDLNSSLPNSALMATISLIVLFSAFGNSLLPQGELGPSKSSFPYESLDFLNESAGESQATVASHLGWGGFITLKGYPKLQPILDDRLTIHDEAFYREYLEEFTLHGDWRGYLKRHRADYLLLPRRSLLAGYLLEQAGVAPLVEEPAGYLFDAQLLRTDLG